MLDLNAILGYVTRQRTILDPVVSIPVNRSLVNSKGNIDQCSIFKESFYELV